MFLKSYDVDVYWKEINFEAASKSQKDEETLDTMKAVYSSLAETSATKLRGKETTVNEETLKKNMEKLKGENLSSELSKMNNNLSAAAKSINRI